MSSEKVIIIGGGISALVSGIFALKKGYEVALYEKNNDVGGLLIKNNFKKDYLNDSFTYFYYDEKLKYIYDEIGLSNIEEIDNEFYLQYKDLKLYRDTKKLEEALITKYRLDEKKIKSFIKIIEEARLVNLYYEKPYDCLSLLEPLKYNASLRLNSKLYSKYHNVSIEKYFSSFEAKEIKDLFLLLMPEKSSIYNLILLLALYSSGRMKRININSFEIIKRIKERFLSLGGRIEVNKIAESIDISKGKAIGVWFNNKHYVNADYVISAVDINYTYKSLLKNKYSDKKLEIKNMDYKAYPTYSLLSMEYMIKDDKVDMPYVFSNDIDKKKIASSYIDKISFINRGNGIISCNILQSGEDYIYWKLLNKNPSLYNKEINKVSEFVAEELEKTIFDFFDIKTKVKELSIISPLDYEEKYNCYKASVFSHSLNSSGKTLTCDGRVSNVKNLYLASQGLSNPGGIVNAIMNSYYAVLRLEHDKEK